MIVYFHRGNPHDHLAKRQNTCARVPCYLNSSRPFPLLIVLNRLSWLDLHYLTALRMNINSQYRQLQQVRANYRSFRNLSKHSECLGQGLLPQGLRNIVARFFLFSFDCLIKFPYS